MDKYEMKAQEMENGGHHMNGEVKFAPEKNGKAAAGTHHTAKVSPEPVEEDDSKDKKKIEKEEKPPMIPFSTLYRYATGLDKFLLFLGILGALLHGAIVPSSFILFGELTDDFIDYGREYTILLQSTNSTNGSAAPIPKPFDLEEKMGEFAIWYVILALINFVVAYLQTATWAIVAERLTYKIRLALFRSVMYQDIAWFDSHDAGEVNSRLTEDLTKIHNGIGDKVTLLFQCLTVFLGGFIIGFIYGPKLTAVIIALTPVLALVGMIMSKLITGLTSDELDSYAKAGSIAEEVISSIRTVAAFGGEKKEHERYCVHLSEARKCGIRKGLNTGLGFGLLYIVMFGCYALAFWYGAKLIIDGEMTGGKLLIVFFSVLTAAFQLGQAGPYVEAISTARGAGYKVFMIIDRVPPIDASNPGGEQPDKLQGDISFENIDFYYPSRPEVQVLKKMNLEISSGKTIALVGESGCGKSTTTKLILRFYDPNSGTVKVDGKDIKDLNLKWLRNHIGVVSQEPVLFATTISENIRYGLEGVTQEQIEAAAKSANAHSFITSFPQGYDTLVGERGTQMSGGQKQRIAIARALIKDPKILLLDEATSALDTESEGIVQAALDQARQGRTTIVIAHRLSTVRTADTIAAFQDGVIVEQGSHEELMQINGVYNQLVTLQTFTEEGGEEEDAEEDAEEKEITQGVKLLRSLSNMSSASEGETELERNLSRRLSRKLSGGKRKRTVSERSTTDVKKVEEPVEEEEVEKAPFLRIMKLNLSEWPYLILGLIGAILNGVFPMVFALIFGEILAVFALTDEDEMRKEANFWSMMFLALGGASFLGNFMQSFFFAVSGETLTQRLRSTAFKSILRQDIAFFDDPKHSTGALTTLLSTHASKIQGAAGLRLGTMLMTLVMGVGCLILALINGWKLTLVMVAFVPLLVITGIIQMKQLTGTTKTVKDAEECGKVAVEAIENIHTVVALSKEETFIKNYDKALIPSYKKGLKDGHVIGISFGLSESIMFLCFAAAFYYGGVLVNDGEMNFEQVMKVVLAIMMGAMTAGNMSAGTPDYAKARIAGTHLFKLFDKKPTIDHDSLEGIKLDSVKGALEVRNVQFRYPTRPDQKILRDMSLTVEPGQTLALVGSSGCGKSTIVSLLERFYDTEAGSLLIDGQEIKCCNVQWLRSQMGIVSQEPVLFDCSIRDNIAYGDITKNFMQEDIEEAAKSANIHSFIETLPDGYNTMVGDKGALISGGQKQRIAIARALIRKPKVLLLDEATSALDTESEKVVQEALDAASEGRTCIVIAHRLSTIQNADKICVIHAGKVVETGTHQELLALKGTYYLLNSGQT